MKTIFLTTAILLATVIGINNTVTAAPQDTDQTYTVLTETGAINKIEVYGNVELYVSDGDTDNVKVYNSYYKESAMVQNQNGTLRISSYKNEKLVVWVTANDLRSLSAYDNAQVKSFGKLSAIELDVKLFNNASAKLNMDAFQASVTVNDSARAILSGNVNNCELKYDLPANINTGSLACASLVQKSTNNQVKDTSGDFAAL
jgi:phage gp45-like